MKRTNRKCFRNYSSQSTLCSPLNCESTSGFTFQKRRSLLWLFEWQNRGKDGYFFICWAKISMGVVTKAFVPRCFVFSQWFPRAHRNMGVLKWFQFTQCLESSCDMDALLPHGEWPLCVEGLLSLIALLAVEWDSDHPSRLGFISHSALCINYRATKAVKGRRCVGQAGFTKRTPTLKRLTKSRFTSILRE